MTDTDFLLKRFKNDDAGKSLEKIAASVMNDRRISAEEALTLYHYAELPYLSWLANHIKTKKNKNIVCYNQNAHIEPTNICRYNCRFCSYSAKKGEKGSWEYSLDDIKEKVKQYKKQHITEIHIVGGVHPDHDIHYYGEMVKAIKEIIPHIHIKAFTAVELEHMINKAGMETEEGIKAIKAYGVDSLPGGGAEIFDETIRKQICPDKTKTEDWLRIHELAHQNNLSSNATMLYGHVEAYEHRIDHLERLRKLQDKTNGFNAFIPLKFKNYDNGLSGIEEVSIVEDMKNYAISRIFLDNIQHIKAYWPMIGQDSAQLSLYFGVDDMDGTINDSTKIYAMAGAYVRPSMTTDEINELISKAGMKPVERDSLYNVLK